MTTLDAYEIEQRDKLTGLFHRNYFFGVIHRYIEKYRDEKDSFAIVILDIEDLSEFNNSLGFDIGNEILIKLSNVISIILNESCFLSRIGGDEFAFLMEACDEKEIIDCIESILHSLSQSFKIGERAIHIKLNVGVSRYPQDGETVDTLIKNAHIATYKTKRQGHNRICFYSSQMYSEIDERLNIINHLFDALKNRELYIAYQPIYDIDRKDIIGAEALLRWDNPILGEISPNKFIAIAEETGQIYSIGNWVINEVCKQVNIWKCKSYQPIFISVNISVKQLEHTKFSETIIGILKKNNVEPCNIELEITESVALGDGKIIARNLCELKNAGFKISIDDFGTGFSSLKQFYLLEPDTIKIDKVFIDDLVGDLKSRNLLKLIIDMGKSLNLSVAAEGIETNEQLCQLKELGCQLGQGYLFSKPLLAEEMGYLLR